MNTLSRKVYLVGGHCTQFIGKNHPNFISKNHPEFGKKQNPNLEWYIAEAVNGALKNTNVSAKAVDKAYIGNFAGELFSNQGHLGAAVVGANTDLRHKPVGRVEAACASGSLAFSYAVDAIQGGSNVCLVVGAEVQNTVSPRQGGDFLARASHYATQRALDDFTFPALFARRIKAYFEKYRDVPMKELGYLSVKAYGNGNKNPLAHMQNVKMDFETASNASDRNPNFLSNKDLFPYLRTSDCSQVSDGGCAVIVVSEAGLNALGIPKNQAIELLGLSHATDNLYETGDLTAMTNTKAAATRLYEATKVKPSDIQVAEVHDCFSMAEVQMTEALGFAEPGKGVLLAKDGHSGINGRIPVNTGGGLISFGHPVGATGVKQLFEVYRQMKGQCGQYQIPKIPSLGLTANMGGDDKTSIVSIWKNL